MAQVFESPEMVAGYTRSRPPVHPYVLELVRTRLDLTMPLARALDVGCGAGLSTSPLRGIAGFCIGVDPVEAMVRASPARAVGVRFAAARAEGLPLRSATVDVVTAAGSLNYVDLEAFFPETGRVLRPGGALMVYDFTPGRRFPDSDALDEWFTELLRRYPAERAARALDPKRLAEAAVGFALVGAEEFDVAVRLDPAAYTDYVMTETNVAHAIARGEDRAGIREWLDSTLDDVFESGARDVVFEGYLAHLAPT